MNLISYKRILFEESLYANKDEGSSLLPQQFRIVNRNSHTVYLLRINLKDISNCWTVPLNTIKNHITLSRGIQHNVKVIEAVQGLHFILVILGMPRWFQI